MLEKAKPLRGIPSKSNMVFYDIELSQKAKLELDEAFNWYNAKIEGLGIRLLREIDAHLSQTITNLNIYQIRFEEDIRVAPLNPI